MLYFAKVEPDSTVSEVIIVAETDCSGMGFPDSEPIGRAFLSSLGKTGEWVQTSPTGQFRKYGASVGCQYIASADVFTQPKPYSSWVLDSNYEWQAPVSKPDADGFWYWDEATQQWVR